MADTRMPLDPNDAPEGFVAVEDTGDIGCSNCDLSSDGFGNDCPFDYDDWPNGGPCQSWIRHDGHSVIFIKRED